MTSLRIVRSVDSAPFTAAELLEDAQRFFGRNRWECPSIWEASDLAAARQAAAEKTVAAYLSGEPFARYRAACVESLDPMLDDDGRAQLASGTLQPTDALVAARSWWLRRHEKRWLFLMGHVGVGKSLAANALRLDLMLDRFDELFRARAAESIARCRTAPDRVSGKVSAPTAEGVELDARRLREHFSPWGSDGEQWGRVDRAVPLLVIQDLGCEDLGKPGWQDTFGELVEHRLRTGVTIVTSNLRKSDLRLRYGDRIADRLNAVAEVYQLTGQSLRGRSGGAGL